ncbi:hypothetical protein BU26DRAFT_523725 [Trematosphaeria pertusa]|uniref:Uncharacterized protein n=1 Tax=Trematosphaeria pertusa TaxID=390896 RepID=A0A6A6I0B2_9PLEO|nr:uncharacterized protein BU26DRAFT_523725 [Trematosphaeria pertusa]KAF2243412.1 hypothetical protein BU26DRAFT_523725 [Trematosphaeria pertusa]
MPATIWPLFDRIASLRTIFRLPVFLSLGIKTCMATSTHYVRTRLVSDSCVLESRAKTSATNKAFNSSSTSCQAETAEIDGVGGD